LVKIPQWLCKTSFLQYLLKNSVVQLPVSVHVSLNDNEQLLTPPLSFMGGVEWLRAEIC